MCGDIMAKKKTHEEYVEELKVKNPTVEVVGEYIDAKTKIMHHCLTHDVYWEVLPSDILSGRGCKECKKDKIGNFRRKSHEQYIEELAKINSDIIVLEKYENAKTPILHKCLIHDIEWLVAPDNLLDGGGCPKCKGEKITNCKCKTHEQYIDEVKKVNPNIVVLEKYIDNRTPILHRCTIHNIDWKTIPSNILKGRGCKQCKGEKIANIKSKSHEQYVQEVKEVNPDVIVLGNYVNAHTPILHKCLIDGYEWSVIPDSILHGFGCPQCCESSGERSIRQLLQSNNVLYEYQKVFSDCRDVQPLPFDFYLPDYNVCIEYDGRQHYEPIERFGGQNGFEYIKNHDEIKTNFCKNNNIPLLRIPYYANIHEELNNFLFI